jgi:hypothetical protein
MLYNLDMKLLRSRRSQLIAGAVLLVSVATPTALILLNNDTPKAPDSKSSSVRKQTNPKTEQEVQLNEQSATQQQVAVQSQDIGATDPAPEPPTNPYPEGFNVWHSYNRRTAVGLSMPDGPKSDQTYWSAVRNDLVTTPSVHAVVFATTHALSGFVESINADGSFMFSCTNCGSGWNTYVEKQVASDQAYLYRFLQ